MKKAMFFLAVGAMALTACTQTEVVEEGVQGNAIGFQNMVGKETRALSQDNLTKFEVYSYYTPKQETGGFGDPVNVFDGEDVTLSGTTWGYTNTRYWIPEAKYYFYAYSCENESFSSGATASMNLSGENEAARALRINNFVCNSTHQHDLVFAQTTQTALAASGTTTPANPKVALTFKHILTRVNVKFTSDFAPGYEIKVKNVQITNLRDKGNYSAATVPGLWSSQNRTSTEDETQGTYGPLVKFEGFIGGETVATTGIASKGATAAEDVACTTTNCFVLPYSYQTEGDVKLRFEIEVVDTASGQTILTRSMSGSWAPTWELGTSYTYNVKITGTATDLEPIVFETKENMNVDGWTPGSTTGVDMSFSAN